MGIIKDRFKAKADIVAAEIKDLLKEHGSKVAGEVQLSQIYQGMRGMTGLVTETSLLDAQEGIRFRRYSIPELRAKLTKSPGGSEPLPEGLFYLMLVYHTPTKVLGRPYTRNHYSFQNFQGKGMNLQRQN